MSKTITKPWRTVQIPSVLAEQIADYTSRENKTGHTSISDFVSDYVRKGLKEVGVIVID